MIDYRKKMEKGWFYHVYNRGNNSERLFYTHGNYAFFLKRYEEYLSNHVDTYAYCLMPNHFHFLIRVKEGACQTSNVSHIKKEKHLSDGIAPKNHEETVSKQFKTLFTSYAKALNKQESRHGSLFEKPFRRIEVNSQNYLVNIVKYIHKNPQKHGVMNDFENYTWSSYPIIKNNYDSYIKKEEVLSWFDTKENFVACHKTILNDENIKDLLID